VEGVGEAGELVGLEVGGEGVGVQVREVSEGGDGEVAVSELGGGE